MRGIDSDRPAFGMEFTLAGVPAPEVEADFAAGPIKDQEHADGKEIGMADDFQKAFCRLAHQEEVKIAGGQEERQGEGVDACHKAEYEDQTEK